MKTLLTITQVFCVLFLTWILLLLWIYQIERRDFVCFNNNNCFTVFNETLIKGRYYGFHQPSEGVQMLEDHYWSVTQISNSSDISISPIKDESLLLNKAAFVATIESENNSIQVYFLKTNPQFPYAIERQFSIYNSRLLGFPVFRTLTEPVFSAKFHIWIFALSLFAISSILSKKIFNRARNLLFSKRSESKPNEES